jgi:raffinose/stachyose/melibiose transport system permease protein
MKKRKAIFIYIDIFAVLMSIVLYGVPFYFVILNSLKDKTEAGQMNMKFPGKLNFSNYVEVIKAENYAVLRAFYNSIFITVFSLIGLVIVCSMLGFFMQRRSGSKVVDILNFFILTGLMIPPAIVPTIWVMQGVGVYKTLQGMILVEIALHLSFGCILYRGFMASIPRELDDAAVIDGCGRFRLFFSIIFPLLKPVTSTIIVVAAIGIFNDFVHPLYFLPGKQNITVQTTLYQFTGMYFSQWNLLFADVVLISIPPLILFIFFNKKIVAGMVAGAIKG